MKLYELTESFAELFSQFEDINEYEPDTDADGQPIDGNGDIIEDVEAYKEKMLTAWIWYTRGHWGRIWRESRKHCGLHQTA